MASANEPKAKDKTSTAEIMTTLAQFGDAVEVRSSEDVTETVFSDDAAAEGAAEGSAEAPPPHDDDTEDNASLSFSYSAEFERLFRRPQSTRYLRNRAIIGKLRSCRFRSLCWKVFLGVLPEGVEDWGEATRRARAQYQAVRDRLIVDPRTVMDPADITKFNPLSLDEESPWNQYFQDQELKALIQQDVVRTFPDMHLFRSEVKQELLTNVLFCFAKMQPQLSYRQGMHELLAPLVFVLHSDHQAFLHAQEMNVLEGVMADVLDPAYLEHDAYELFCRVMSTVEPWYNYGEPVDAQPPLSERVPFTTPDEVRSSSCIVQKLAEIQEGLLKLHDIQLYLHLKALDIAPQIYGLRWLRLLFGREFPIQDLLVVWDALFADSCLFHLADHLFVAMLMYIRDTLLRSDYPEALNLLMRFPPVGDVFYILQHALHLKQPQVFKRPPAYVYQRTTPISDSVERGRQMPHVGVRRAVSETPQTRGRHARSRANGAGKGDALESLASKLRPPGPAPGRKPGAGRGQGKAHPAAWADAPLRGAEGGDMAGSSSDVSSMARLAPTRPGAARTPLGGVDQFNVELPDGRIAGLRLKGKKEAQLSQQVRALTEEVEEGGRKCGFCADKLNAHIEEIQRELLGKMYDEEDKIMVALAGIKQVRDILTGTLRFSAELQEAIMTSSASTSPASGSHVTTPDDVTSGKPPMLNGSDVSKENGESP